MPFPESPRVFFRNNPLVEVVCQLRFPPILRIATEEPAEFQEVIRDEYPMYRREKPVFESEEIEDLVRQIGLLKDTERVIHKFLTEDEGRYISLAREFVAVTEHSYREWQEFVAEIHRMMDAVQDTYAPKAYSRIGLRYRDVIDREALGLEDAPWAELLNSSLLGLLGEDRLAPRVQNTRSQVEFRLDDPAGSRCTLRHGFAQRSDGDVTVYLVDADFHTQHKMGGEDALDALERFNRVAGNLFRWAITSVLERALEPENAAVE